MRRHLYAEEPPICRARSRHTRQFLEKLDKPDADRLEEIPPAIAVAARAAAVEPGTVGT